MGKQAKRNDSRRKSTLVEARPQDHKAVPQGLGKPPRRILRDILLGIAVCVAFFSTLETVLRVTGIPSLRVNDDPYVGFSGLQPLFAVKDGTATTADSKLKYFNKIAFAVEKRPGTVRVFCFGGSTTYGHPFDGRTAFPRWLGEILAASTPGKNFEVLNAGGISYASYRIKPLVKEALNYQPDLVVILTGENEFLEWRTYTGLLDQGRTLVTMKSLLERVHIYRCLELWLKPLAQGCIKARDGHTDRGQDVVPPSVPPRQFETDRPQKTMLEDEVTTILDQSAGLERYRRDDEFSRGVVQHFTRNLGDILQMCRDAGVPVVLVEPVANLKDFSPFKSEHGTGLDKTAATRIEQDLESARHSIQQNEFDKALEILTASTEADPLYAMTHYLTGKALLGLGRRQEALESFVRAKDLDVCPLRAPSGVLHELRLAGREAAVPLIPFQELLSKMSVPGDDGSGIAGNERMLDHVHPTIQGHQLLAEAILQEMVERGIVRPNRRLSREDKDAIYTRVLKGLDQRLFALRDWNLAKTLYWSGKRDEARAALLRSVEFMDSHPEAHAMLGSFLLDDRNYERAVAEFEKAVALSNNKPALLYGLAIAYHASGRKDRAERTLRLLVDGGEPMAEAYCKLALIYLGSSRTEEAIHVLNSGLRKSPHSPPLLAGYGLAMCLSGKSLEGIPWMLNALEKEPGNPDYLHDLAMMYALTGQKDKALDALQTAVQNGYGEGSTLADDPVFESIRHDERFQEILARFGYKRALSQK